MNLSLLAAVLLLLWLLMPCALSPITFGRLWPSAPLPTAQPGPAADPLARLYRRPPLAGSQFPVPRKTNGLAR